MPRSAGLIDGRAERPRPTARLGDGVEQAPLLGAVAEHPTQLAADARDGQAAPAHSSSTASAGWPASAAREVDPPELDGRPAGRARGAERGGEGRGVEGPGVERQPVAQGDRPRAHGAQRPARC